MKIILYNDQRRSFLPLISKVDLLQLHLDIPIPEEGVFKNLHDVLGGSVKVVLELFFTNHVVGRGRGFCLTTPLDPGQKLLVLFLSFKGVEDVGLLAEEAIDGSRSTGVSEGVRHEFQQ